MDKFKFTNCYLTKFLKIGDDKKGFLFFFESKRNIPFNIKRIYYIYGIGDLSTIRGPHAHKTTEQIFICLNGKVTYFLDDGENETKITITKPNIGIYIGPKIWHYMTNFSKNAIILGIASSYYNENDYIRNYNDFISYVKKTI